MTQKQPTIQGNLSVTPEHFLNNAAKSLNADVSTLKTVHISYSSNPLYPAILEYAALHLPTTGFKGPTPLYIDNCDAYKHCPINPEILSRMDHGAFGTPFRTRRALQLMHDEDDDIAVTSETKFKQEYKLKFSFGETVVSWPPPHHLEAKQIIQKRVSGVKRQQFDSETNDAASCNSNSVEKRASYFITHYQLGDPCPKVPGSLFRYVAIASVEDISTIETFCTELSEWYKKLMEPARVAKGFSLYRYRMENDSQGYWHGEGVKHPRPADSVILQSNQMEDIMNEVEDFFSKDTRNWYMSHGIPNRRCFLFYGPPGTGKTSTVRAIASHFHVGCCFLTMTHEKFSNQALGDAFSSIPNKRSILVIEDVDSLFNSNRESKMGNSLSFSGLLNALDGMMSSDDILTILTTNFPSKLDKALTRGGRVDRRFYFGPPSSDQMVKFFLSFYPDESKEMQLKFIKKVEGWKDPKVARNMANLQELFASCRRKNATECIESIEEFFKSRFECEDMVCDDE